MPKVMLSLDERVALLSAENRVVITLSDFNSKLGDMPNFSLIPGESCTCATELCSNACYAKAYCRVYKSSEVAYYKNMQLVLLDPNWQMPIIKDLSKRPKYFRIHTAGDFFSPKYINEWENIIKAFPETRFLAFTRAWRNPRLRKELNRLRKLPNCQIIASIDAEAHNAPKGWRTASMGKPETMVGPTIMCPNFGPAKLTCDKCGICFKSLRCNLWFPIHGTVKKS